MTPKLSPSVSWSSGVPAPALTARHAHVFAPHFYQRIAFNYEVFTNLRGEVVDATFTEAGQRHTVEISGWLPNNADLHAKSQSNSTADCLRGACWSDVACQSSTTAVLPSRVIDSSRQTPLTFSRLQRRFRRSPERARGRLLAVTLAGPPISQSCQCFQDAVVGLFPPTWEFFLSQKSMADCHPKPAVLLVQPERDDRDMYGEFLRYRGFIPIAVSTAVEALSIAPRANVIVAGILLRGSMDGIALVERLKSGSDTSHIPVIVLTACAWPADRHRARVAGCDVFLVKPCLPDRLVQEIRRVMMAARPQPVAVTPGFSNGRAML